MNANRLAAESHFPRCLLLCLVIGIMTLAAVRPQMESAQARTLRPQQVTQTPTATDEPGSLPDLVIAGWSFTHDFITCPSFIRWDYVIVRIQNLGGAAAEPFVVLSANHRWNVDGMAPHSELYLPRALGDIGLPAKIDALDQVTESDESNNFVREEPNYTKTPSAAGDVLAPLRTQPPTCTKTPTPSRTPTATQRRPAWLPWLGDDA